MPAIDYRDPIDRAHEFARLLSAVAKLADLFAVLADAEEDNAGDENTAADYYYAHEQLRKLASDIDHHTTN